MISTIIMIMVMFYIDLDWLRLVVESRVLRVVDLILLTMALYEYARKRWDAIQIGAEEDSDGEAGTSIANSVEYHLADVEGAPVVAPQQVAQSIMYCAVSFFVRCVRRRISIYRASP